MQVGETGSHCLMLQGGHGYGRRKRRYRTITERGLVEDGDYARQDKRSSTRIRACFRCSGLRLLENHRAIAFGCFEVRKTTEYAR